MNVSAPVRPAVRRRRRYVGVALAVAGVMLLAWAAFGIRIVLFPQHDPVERSDAIVVLGPVPEWRQDMAAELVDEGLADTVAYTSFTHSLSEAYCDPIRPGVETLCYKPDPLTTQGEAAWVKDQAAQRGWERVIVITMDSHIERSRFIFNNCVGDDLEVDVTGRRNPSEDLEFLVWQFFYQTFAFAKAVFVTPGC
ncbi:YdcF family protein [Microbacterium album]|uniref:DUF218 domain-containing protein n=1 Tax=Microbacterium album TaxID=2053191 RepID=A0A917MLI5_9MICO|nr:ElyC/SanA/YdcF family protein [Microbacterium album]GGH41114.1 hypothetical protein GCM10010921_13470 [Microbacterium album]